ncbi:glycosyltransferase family 1 protein [Pseudomonas sp. 102515]|uniref:glycosyltransferase family 4 protein n=1 Tax=Pseudomonas sp. 102515 TaxID=3071568 RepID=UPI00280367EF|nr:glycosyltransferase family 1 protein [Pseudomonas sp. 102515]MDQ7914264.1 glycosyltransferase family 1 protein [Pseudomonas sp. 102515]
MRIVLDLQGAQTESRYRGIGRYCLSLAQGIARNRGEHELILLLNGQFADTILPIRQQFQDLLPASAIQVWYGTQPTAVCLPGNEWRRAAAELLREAFIATLEPDVVLICSLFEGTADNAIVSLDRFQAGCPTAVILYDLIPLMNPEQYLDPHPVFKSFYLDKIEQLQAATGWLGISESSCREGREIIGLPQERLFNISTAADPQFAPQVLEPERRALLLEKFSIQKDFALYTGGADARKNLERLIEAYARLSAPSRAAHQLVLAGKMPEQSIAAFKAHAARVGIAEHELIFTGYITDHELIGLYTLCKVFVFPSWHEGFGLPALEAMSCGAPVIGSNRSSIPEVIGNPDSLFDPLDVTGMAEMIERVLDDEIFRQELIRRGLEQSGHFSWDLTANRCIHALEQLATLAETSLQLAPESRLSLLRERVVAIETGVPTYDDLKACAVAMARNFQSRSSRKLFVDISQLVHVDSKSGIQRVVRSILKELLVAPPVGYEVKPVYATMDSRGYRHANAFVKESLAEFVSLDSSEDTAIDYGAGDVFFGLDLQHHVVMRQQEEHLAMRNAGVKVVFVVYDLLPITMPEVFRDFIGELHQDWLTAIAQNDGLLCISAAVADDMQRWLAQHLPEGCPRPEVGWFHLGADVEGSIPTRGYPEDAESVLARLRERPTFLSVGTIEPRKGHDQTLAAFEVLWQRGVDANLVLVGQAGWNVDALIERLDSHPMRGAKLFWLKGISDEYLTDIYNTANGLIFSSKGEGFGLPLIEAAQHGLPIIARDLPVFREIAGEHVTYFRGIDAQVLADCISQWMESKKLGRPMPDSSKIKWLTWKESKLQVEAMLLKFRADKAK